MGLNLKSASGAILLGLFFVSCAGEAQNTKRAFEAAAQGNWDTASEHVRKGVELNSINQNGYTLLHLSENADLTALLIQQGHDVNMQSGGMFTKTEKDEFLAASKILANVSPKMKAELSDINEDDPYFGKNLSPLHTVTNSDAVKILLDAGANVNAVSLYGATPIAKVRELGSLKHMMSAGASMQVSNYGRSPLHQFFKNNDIKSFQGGQGAYFEAIRLFVESGVDLKTKDNGDRNVLHAANYKASPEMLTYLLKRGADPKMDDGNWGGAFCLAVKESKDDLLLPYVSHDFTLLYHNCEGERMASVYAKEEAKYNTTYYSLIKMEEIVANQLQKE
jgi:hypothetical protein